MVERVCGDIRNDFMPPALDFEKYSESDQKDNIPWIQGWIDVVQRRLGRQPMIYTGANVWRYEVGNTAEFIDHPLWQVYYSGEATSPPAMPWPNWTLWQYSGGGDFQHHPPVPGVGVVDVNRFNGDLAALARFAKDGSLPPPPPAHTWPPPPPTEDLQNLRGSYSKYTARVQGLLMAHGYGPDGLVGTNGLPDGMSGTKTESYLVDFKTRWGLPPTTMVDWETWWMLTVVELSAG